MKFLSVRDLRSKSADVWKGLSAEREMVVTSNGRPIAILSAVTEDSLEETLGAIRRSRAIAAFLGCEWNSILAQPCQLCSVARRIIAKRFGKIRRTNAAAWNSDQGSVARRWM